MKPILFAALLAVPAVVGAKPAPAPAAATPAVAKVGAAVIGKDNQPAGTVAEITAQAIVIDTGTNKVPVPVASVGVNPKGLWIGMTRAELDAAFTASTAQAQTSFASQLVPGAMVHGLNNAMLGTVKKVEGQFVDLTTPRGDVRLPLSGFGPGPNGVVQLGLTQEQLYAAMGAAAPAAPAPAATPTS